MIVAIARAGSLWGCASATDPDTRAMTYDGGGARVETLLGTYDDPALAAVAGAGAGWPRA
jgi:hypothetical protein